MRIRALASRSHQGKRLHTQHGLNPAGVAHIGDLDGDGSPELAVGAPRSSAAGTLAGAVHVFSGANWKRIETFVGAFPVSAFGQRILWAPDLDGDGCRELVVGAPGTWDGAHWPRPSVQIFDAKSGHCRALLVDDEREAVDLAQEGERTTRMSPHDSPDRFLPQLGRAVTLANLDGDKLADLVIGDPSYQSPRDAGRVIAISGAVLSRSLAATK